MATVRMVKTARIRETQLEKERYSTKERETERKGEKDYRERVSLIVTHEE